jgi:hypothetical protein
MGEALAVTWNCLHLDTPGEETVEIRGTVIRIKGKGLSIKPAPKSEAGIRTLAIPSWYAAQLRARKPADTPTGDTVFTSLTSTGLRDPSNASGDLRDAFSKGSTVMEQIVQTPAHNDEQAAPSGKDAG